VKYLVRFLASDRVHHTGVQLWGFPPEPTGKTGETGVEGEFRRFCRHPAIDPPKVVHHAPGIQEAGAEEDLPADFFRGVTAAELAGGPPLPPRPADPPNYGLTVGGQSWSWP
jgi:hypothetical protein